MPAINNQDLLKLIANANERALKGEVVFDEQERTKWLQVIDDLCVESCPRTYLAVFGVLVAARSLQPKEALNVRDIKTGSSDKGYSAASIGSTLASFAKAHDIDLRAGSSQPMNNQPFTFEDFILDDMGVRASAKSHWENFIRAVNEIDSSSSETAQDLLTLIFSMRRKVAKPAVVAHSSNMDLAKIEDFVEAVDSFVTANSDGGKIGQAFASALLTLLYGSESVLQGDSQDPDASLVGDVHVAAQDQIIIFSEVKQKVIGTGEVKGFIQSVNKARGRKILYFALSNSAYTGHLDEKQISKEVLKADATFKLFTSTHEAVTYFLPFINSSLDDFAELFALTFLHRLNEAKVKGELISNFKQSVSSFVTFTDDLGDAN
jgi:hypothetical protein